MSVAKLLYQLQQVELEIESKEQALKQLLSQLGESQAVARAQAKLASEQQRLEESKHEQHTIEWEIDDLSTKITTAEETLYSGRIKNPKELTSLQHEIVALKAKRSQLEDRTLEIMGQVELATASVATIKSELKRLETEWQNQQQQLSQEIDKLKSKLSNLKEEQQLLSAEINPRTLELYHALKKQKKIAVVKVEQGICIGCRISLPTTDLQRARSGSLAQCSSCGRILLLT